MKKLFIETNNGKIEFMTVTLDEELLISFMDRRIAAKSNQLVIGGASLTTYKDIRSYWFEEMP